MAVKNPKWRQIPKEKFIKLSKQFKTSGEFARHFGLSKSTFINGCPHN